MPDPYVFGDFVPRLDTQLNFGNAISIRTQFPIIFDTLLVIIRNCTICFAMTQLYDLALLTLIWQYLTKVQLCVACLPSFSSQLQNYSHLFKKFR